MISTLTLDPTAASPPLLPARGTTTPPPARKRRLFCFRFRFRFHGSPISRISRVPTSSTMNALLIANPSIISFTPCCLAVTIPSISLRYQQGARRVHLRSGMIARCSMEVSLDRGFSFGPICDPSEFPKWNYDESSTGQASKENIFNLMRKEEKFSGQTKLMEWILQIRSSDVLHWFLTKGGLPILATWLSQAAAEEQTTLLHVMFKLQCHFHAREIDGEADDVCRVLVELRSFCVHGVPPP